MTEALYQVLLFGGERAEEFAREPLLHCPGCSAAGVFVEQDDGDYYQGPCHICIACGSEFTMPTFRAIEYPNLSVERLSQLKADFAARHGVGPKP